MSNLRQSRRQQHLTPERREEDDIDHRGTKRRQFPPYPPVYRTEKERMGPQDGKVHSQEAATDRQATKTPRGDISLTQEDVVNNDEAKGDSDLRADKEQSITGEYVASIGLPSRSSSGISGASSSGIEQPRVPPNKRRRYRRRPNNKSTARGQSSTQKLTGLMAQQQSPLEKYEQKLQRTSSERPTTMLSPNKASTSREDNLTFRIQGRSQQHHGLEYESPGLEGQLSEEEDTLSSLEEAPSFQEFAREQVLAKQNPHGKEALKTRQDQMSTTHCQHQQRQSFERVAASEYVQTPKYAETTLLTSTASEQLQTLHPHQ
ncbi:hypothetical protein SARC_02936 [Sphaeroforma arctica JP610]|uniref:Uncharacterized protein n=1 Tax=Sphaeroforma arctica JP610 TaxID=667725 RepID=A0A0L0G7F6_9EUKA|nr:hypothetical protein SARC_02936 [Sphaeroforma arctica JP610]KNC84854.1 hypothetical protein SARC_02936 [Sphaeroforma arctica JP610]|eukprot:XP_014158756.1 hypothetical protein SARC_02936 [Sphaeroforma arctica JP610]